MSKDAMIFGRGTRSTGIGMIFILALSVLAQGVNSNLSTNAASESAAAPGMKTGPRLVFEKPIYNFGKVPAGEGVRCNFKFLNSGDETLHIQDLSINCGCTSVGEWPHMLAPGASGILPVVLDTSHLNGAVSKKIPIQSDAVNGTNLVLVMTGLVWKPVELSPLNVSFGLLNSRNALATKTVKITNNCDELMTVESAMISAPCFRLDLKTIKEGKEFELAVATVPPLTNGNNYGTITIKTSLAKKPTISLFAQAMVMPVQLFPPRLLLYRHTNDAPVTLSVVVKNNQDQPFKLTQVSVNDPRLKTGITEMIPDKQYRIDLTLPPLFQIPQGEHVSIKISTTLAEMPSLEVPILQL